MASLRDALATALAARLDVRYGTVTDWGAHLSDAILFDPAVRAALTEALAVALKAKGNDGSWSDDWWHEDADDLVARMLDGDRG